MRGKIVFEGRPSELKKFRFVVEGNIVWTSWVELASFRTLYRAKSYAKSAVLLGYDVRIVDTREP